MRIMLFSFLAACAAPLSSPPAPAELLSRLGGCFIVDYNFHEKRALQGDYTRDERVYDVNRDKTVFEWIAVTSDSADHVRLQHVLFARDGQGAVREASMMRHQAEDWERAPSARYDFLGPGHWRREALTGASDTWLRSVTDLDDGLRYQCAAEWRVGHDRAEWTCRDLAPIPGRETRDMQRKDYDTLDRTTHIVAFTPSGNWVERQDNVKISHRNEQPIALAEEAGRSWYVRVPDAQCKEAKRFAEARAELWRLSRRAWSEYLRERDSYVETTASARSERFRRFGEVEDEWVSGRYSEAEALAALRVLIAQ